MSKIDEYIKQKSEENKEWQKKFELEYKKLLDSLKYDSASRVNITDYK